MRKGSKGGKEGGREARREGVRKGGREGGRKGGRRGGKQAEGREGDLVSSFALSPWLGLCGMVLSSSSVSLSSSPAVGLGEAQTSL